MQKKDIVTARITIAKALPNRRPIESSSSPSAKDLILHELLFKRSAVGTGR